MADLILRWTYGEIRNGYNIPQGIELLKYSIKFAILIFSREFEQIEYYICNNNVRKSSLEELRNLSGDHKVKLIDVSEMLPLNLRIESKKNSWWKYAIPRLDIDKYELIIDNDVILWKIPNILRTAIIENALIALSDGAGKFYGDFLESVERIDRNLKLNAGLIGFPRGVMFDLTDIFNSPPKDLFFSEQGFTAYNFAQYNGSKYLVPISEIQQLNINRIGALKLLSNYKGGHFCGCNYGPESFWDKLYRKHIINLYKKLEKMNQ